MHEGVREPAILLQRDLTNLHADIHAFLLRQNGLNILLVDKTGQPLQKAIAQPLLFLVLATGHRISGLLLGAADAY